MRFWGIEPEVFALSFPYMLLAFYLNSVYGWNLRLPFAGLVLLSARLILWIACYSQVSRAYSRGRLVKSGCYSKVRHPIYSTWGFLVIPGFSLFIGGFMLLLPLVYWLAMLMFINDEEKALEERFGDEWREYTKRTGKFIPRP